jgi:hypothetical protein
LKKYIESNDCLVDTKEFRVTANLSTLSQEPKVYSKKILTETKVIKKWCFRKTLVPIYGKIAVSLEKEHILNIDSCFNFVV